METKSPPFSHPFSDQSQILPVQGVLKENDRCLDASCRCGFDGHIFCFPRPEILEYTMALPHGNYEPGKLEKKTYSDFPKIVNHISSKTGE